MSEPEALRTQRSDLNLKTSNDLQFFTWRAKTLETSSNSLDEDSVDENKGEGYDEENVGEVEHELGDVVLRAIPLHVPVGNTHLEYLSYLSRHCQHQVKCPIIISLFIFPPADGYVR